ncbi:ankyrin repeat-containing protein BDA1-like [Alnus glutinosa]|uniref:ankyrin repeat-containing protein BDA1-like n=1 Tax=Alnus glutinosa TaxID=3517 RepID=UPI002D79AD73|nr:ankyrin repeat-containing protein BDA1-like [Alnus glutinosa]
MNSSLRDAARQGSIDALYASIQSDPEVLDRIDKIPFVETPLHIAAFAGHTQFAMEIMMLKPSFARKLNQDGFTPLHLALQKLRALENDQAMQKKKQTQLVCRLVSVDKDLIRVQGREGVTPLHYVAQIGNLDLLTKFLKVCPTSIEDVTIRGENVLHIALKNNMPKLKAFSYLLQLVLRAYSKDAKLLEEKLLNYTDDEGNTLSLLEVAVSRINQQEANSDEVMRWILGHEPIVLRLLMNMRSDQRKNLESQTSRLRGDNPRIKDILGPRRKYHFGTSSVLVDHIYVKFRRLQTLITEERRNALLVVATLLITVTYPVALSPDQPNELNCTVLNPFNGTGANHFNCTARFNPSSEANPSRDQYSSIIYCLSTAVFFLTNITLFFLVPSDFLGWLLTLLVGLLFLCYCLSTPLLSNARIIAWFGFYGEFLVMYLVSVTVLHNYLVKLHNY